MTQISPKAFSALHKRTCLYDNMPELCTAIPLPHLSQFYLILLFLIPTKRQVKAAWQQSHWQHTPVYFTADEYDAVVKCDPRWFVK